MGPRTNRRFSWSGSVSPLRGAAHWRHAIGPAIGLVALVLALAAVALPRSAGAECLSPPGDVNGSGATDIADVQCGQLVLLWTIAGEVDPLPGCVLGEPNRADANCSGDVTVADIQLLIQYALGLALSPEIDSNQDGCPDACGPPDLEPQCGDGVCEAPESCVSCAADCGTCASGCCSPREDAGCAQADCEACVCDLDPFCCEDAWDYICAVEATYDCPQACGCPGPSEGACCEEWVVTGCEAPACEACVCGEDAFCCDTIWDAGCRDLAAGSCNEACGCGPLPEGDCCAAHGGPACEAPACAECVCAASPGCCDTAWDEPCALLAASDCNHRCGCTPGAACCTPHPGAGCAAPACESLVCTVDPFCCDVEWDPPCAEAATQICGPDCGGPGPACPSAGDCCEAHGGAGCADASCCLLVCDADPFCCAVGWDALCAEAALGLCASLCDPPPPPPPVCPAAGACDAAHDGAGCEDEGCCLSVCAADPTCCTGSWDATCAAAAAELCALPVSPVCPAPGDCATAHGGLGCESAPCCEAVCAADPWCCEMGWDLLCASQAQALCVAPTPACPAPGDCCEGHGGPGCADAVCCQLVCDADAFCCDVVWDQVCAADAVALCPALCATGTCPGAGDCCGAHEGPGCHDESCCALVCGEDPLCCAVSWDSTCADRALDACEACEDIPPDSCASRCHEQAPAGCWCDEACAGIGDCCDDACAVCGACE